MRFNPPYVLTVALAGAFALGAPAVSARGAPDAAASEADRAEAVRLFREAQALYDKDELDAALEKFRRVDELLASPNARLYVGRCLRRLGRLPEAFEVMADAVRLATEKAKADPSYLQTRDAAAAERERVAAQIGRVVVAAADTPAGIEIELGGRRIEPEMFGRELGVRPGEVWLRATAPGHEPLDRRLEVGAGAVATVAVALRPEGAGPGAEPARSGGGLRTAGFVALGVGAAGMAAFAVAGLLADARYGSIEQECGRPPCRDPKYEDLIAEGKTMDLAANVGLGLGLAALAAGTTMVVLGWPGEPEQPGLAVSLGPGHALLGCGLRF
ncbi:MAG: hypothetical protein HY744_31285 [Deltaproteobacteria bacterium]|nr:hypothetical protein [Deltaproteobacteria bacterium]